MEILATHGANLSDAHPFTFNQPIHIAAEAGHSHVLRFLLQRGVVSHTV